MHGAHARRRRNWTGSCVSFDSSTVSRDACGDCSLCTSAFRLLFSKGGLETRRVDPLHPTGHLLQQPSALEQCSALSSRPRRSSPSCSRLLPSPSAPPLLADLKTLCRDARSPPPRSKYSLLTTSKAPNSCRTTTDRLSRTSRDWSRPSREFFFLLIQDRLGVVMTYRRDFFPGTTQVFWFLHPVSQLGQA